MSSQSKSQVTLRPIPPTWTIDPAADNTPPHPPSFPSSPFDCPLIPPSSQCLVLSSIHTAINICSAVSRPCESIPEMAARNHLAREKSTPRLPRFSIDNTDLFNSGTLPTTGDMDSSHSADIPCPLTSTSVWNCLGRLGGSALLAKNDTRLKSWNGIIAPNVRGMMLRW